MSPFRIVRAVGRIGLSRTTLAALVVAFACLGPGSAFAATEEKPVLGSPPEIVGEHDEEALSASPREKLFCGGGSWSGTGLHFEYEWLRGGVTVKGPGSGEQEYSSYTVSSADEGEEITCNVIVYKGSSKHREGQEEEESVNAVLITGHRPGEKEPTNVKPPEVSPTEAGVGERLTCAHGEWTGEPSKYAYQWLLEGRVISKATEATYSAIAADEGHSLSCSVVAVNNVGDSASQTSSNSAKIRLTAKAPVDKTAPTITGTVELGKQLSCEHGEWSGEPTFTYVWLREGAEIAGATGSTHIVEAADQLHTLSCRVTAKNAGGKAEKESAATKQVPGTKPQNTTPPEITGTAKVEQTLTCSTGKWTGVPESFTYAYQWLLEHTVISNATKATYTVPVADKGKSLYCEVTAKNSAGTGTTSSSAFPIAKEEGTPPVNTKKPAIEGTAKVGASLTCNKGVWTGSPTPTYEYEWVRNLGGAGETLITKGTASTYTVATADAGSTLSCVVVAKNTEGSVPAASAAVAIPAEAPKNTKAPKITPTGEVEAGETLTCSPGEWSGAPTPTLTYEWVLNGTVEVAAGYSYAVSESDEGGSLACRVTAANSAGEKSVESEAVKVAEGPPENTVAPKVTPAEAAPGDTLTCEHGSWTRSPSKYQYQWLLEGSSISGASESTYVAIAADEKQSLSCEVTAVNAGGGSAPTASSNSAQISVSAPVDKTVPVVEGEAVLGRQLSCGHGEWSGEPTYTYQWLREGTEIAGASGITYTVVAADQLHTLSCRVTAKNGGGAASKESASTGEVPGSSPQNTVAPGITGSPEVGQTLTCSEGKWSGAPESFKYTYKWLLGGVALAKATSATFKVVSEDRGKTLACEVTAQNSVGAGTARSNAVVVAEGKSGGSAPVNTTAPLLEPGAEARVGGKLTCSSGEWSGSPEPSYEYEWVRNLKESEEAVISKGTNDAYTVAAADEGAKISCVVFAVNTEGAAQQASSNSVAVKGEAPVDAEPPEIFPTTAGVMAGETLACSAGGWSGKPAPTYEYEWLLNKEPSAPGSSYEPIAHGSSYRVIEADEGGSLVCQVTAKNSTGHGEADSEPVHVVGLAPQPLSEAEPTITGAAEVEGVLRCERGEWSGAPKPTYEYRWLVGGSPIASATAQEYTVRKTNEGRTLSCEVIGKNAEGSTSAYSEGLAIPGNPPEVEEAPQISGTAAVGDTLTCKTGLWSKPTPTLTVQWLREGVPIGGATKTTYVLALADENHSISCLVTAKNSEGSAEASSSPVYVSAVTTNIVQKHSETTTDTEEPEEHHAVSASEILSRLNSELERLQHAVRVKTLRKSHSYTFKFNAPVAGTLEYSWYQVPKGAHISSNSKSKPKPVLVAHASATFPKATSKTLVLQFTKAGLRLIMSRKSIKLTGKGVFRRAGHSPVSWLKGFELVP